MRPPRLLPLPRLRLGRRLCPPGRLCLLPRLLPLPRLRLRLRSLGLRLRRRLSPVQLARLKMMRLMIS